MRPVGPEEEVICPSCKRYVGTFERCPYCGARVPKRPSFRMLKWGGLTVAILGVLLLYADLHVSRLVVQDTPTIGISQIKPTMNFAQVYIEGKATFVKYDKDSRFLGMFVTDENENSIFVRAYDAETLKLIKMEERRLAENDPQPRFPAVGDNVRLRVQLRIRPEFYMVILQYAEGLKIMRPPASAVTVAQIVSNPDNFGEYQRLEVGWDENWPVKVIKVEDVYARGQPEPWATKLTLCELGSEAETAVMIPIVYTKFGSLDAKVGDRIRVKGAFELYDESPQLWLASWDDLKVL